MKNNTPENHEDDSSFTPLTEPLSIHSKGENIVGIYINFASPDFPLEAKEPLAKIVKEYFLTSRTN